MTPLLYLMACLMSPAPLIHLAESRVKRGDGILASSAKTYKFHLEPGPLLVAYGSRAWRALERNCPIEPVGGVPRSSHSQPVPPNGRWAAHR